SSDLVGFTVLDEFLERIGSYRFKQSPAARGYRRIQCKEGFADQTCNSFDNWAPTVIGIGQDGSRRLERKASSENGQSPQHALLRLGQELIAPVEGCTQSPMPRKRRPASSRQQPETVIQARGNLLKPERGGASRRKLDGERYAIKATTDHGNCRKELRMCRQARV